jgi:DNA modification methylase
MKRTTRDSLREGLKATGRTRREQASAQAKMTGGIWKARNDMLPPIRLESIPVAELKSHPRRLRKSDAAHIREVANSISAFGFNVPLLVGRGNLVIDGETRLEAARLLALPTAPCIRVEHLDDEAQRLLRLAINRLAEKGSWDLEELQAEFSELVLADAPIELTGFGSDEVDQIIIGDEADHIEMGQLEPPSGAAPISRIGDLFQLGPHLLLCGDATDPSVLERLMGADKARLVLTDEPFNVKIGGHVTGGDHREFVMASGEMTDAGFLEFNRDWISALLPYLVDGALFGTFIDWRGLPIVHAAATGLGLNAINLIVWGKTNAGMGSLYRSQHELLPLFKSGSATHVNNIALGRRGRHRSNLWVYPGASSLGSDARRGLKEHPTVKPTALLEDALVDLTNRGEIVLEPFAGSESMLIACERTGRQCRCLELDPLYVDVIIRRYQEVPGKKAVLMETGESFDDLAKSRRT